MNLSLKSAEPIAIRHEPDPQRLRGDLIQQSIRMGSKPIWVIKDPIANEFYYFSASEYALLQKLDGRTPEMARDSYNREFPQSHVTTDDVIAFLQQLETYGLLRSSYSKSKVDTTNKIYSKSGLALFSVRWRGIDPQPLLALLYPAFRCVYQPLALALMSALVLAACVMAVVQSESLVMALGSIDHWWTPASALQFLILIVIIKVIHELAHALTCMHFGRRCSEMGILWLLMIPCLYCDVTDAWLETSRAKRILISAAGMIVEIVIASIAMLLWGFSHEGPFNELCLRVVCICSVGTLLINGNPLLKYDGYFIFSDLIQIPNLKHVADQSLMATMRQWFLPSELDPGSRQVSWFLNLYAISSGLYRVTLVFAILWFVFDLGQRFELTTLAGFGIVALVVLMIQPWVKSFSEVWRRWRFRNRTGRLSPMKPVLFLAVAGLGVLFTPLPHSLSTNFFVEPKVEQKIFASAAGKLVSVLAEGTFVEPGTVVAVIEDTRLRRTVDAMRVELVNVTGRLEHIERLRTEYPEMSEQIPALRAAVHAKQLSLQQLESDLERRLLKSEISGTLMAPRNSVSELLDDFTLTTWKGSPLDAQNQDCFVEAGREICSVVSVGARSVALFVSQRDVEMVKQGQTVDLALPGFPTSRVVGTVFSIEANPAKDVPVEVMAQGNIPVKESVEGNRPREPYYRVMIEVGDEISSMLPIRFAGPAQIGVRSQSLVERIRRAIAHNFG